MRLCKIVLLLFYQVKHSNVRETMEDMESTLFLSKPLAFSIKVFFCIHNTSTIMCSQEINGKLSCAGL